MAEIHGQQDYIKLEDFLKVRGLADTGGQAKLLIQDGLVQVNGAAETRRGRKLRVGDRVALAGHPEHVVESVENAGD